MYNLQFKRIEIIALQTCSLFISKSTGENKTDIVVVIILPGQHYCSKKKKKLEPIQKQKQYLYN